MQTTYNYNRFKSGFYDFEAFTGPAIGEAFRDARFTTLEGETVQLSDFVSKGPVVLETGSLTCPMYAASAPPMQTLAEKYPQFQFLLMYVREAHPGERAKAHLNEAEKSKAARASKDFHKDQRLTLIDDIEGTAHKLYGAMPNSIFVIGQEGKILYRSIWNNTDEMDEILSDLSETQMTGKGELKPKPPFGLIAGKTLVRGGFLSFWDFLISFLDMFKKHKDRGNV